MLGNSTHQCWVSYKVPDVSLIVLQTSAVQRQYLQVLTMPAGEVTIIKSLEGKRVLVTGAALYMCHSLRAKCMLSHNSCS